jgi:hypothetical protein
MAALRTVPGLRGRPATYAALILCVALGQEGFQMLYKGQLYLGDTLGDIMVDLIAAGGTWAIAGWQKQKERPHNDSPARG